MVTENGEGKTALRRRGAINGRNPLVRLGGHGTAAIGASFSFPCVPANVPSANPHPPFAAGNGTGATTGAFWTYARASRRTATWMEARATKVARGSAGFSKSLASRLPVAPEPRKGAHEHPATRQGNGSRQR